MIRKVNHKIHTFNEMKIITTVTNNGPQAY